MQDLYTAITPAYQLETDNSSAGEHEESSKSGEDSIAKEPVINIAGCRDDNFILKRCVFLIGQTGERMSKGIFNLDVASEVGIIVDNVQVGSISTTPTTTIIFLSSTIPLSSLHPLSAFLFHLLQPKTVTIINAYHYPSYIFPSTPNDENKGNSTPPVLFLRSYQSPSLSILADEKIIVPFSPPNLVHGIASALFTVSSLPTPIKPTPPPTLLLLLPSINPAPPINPTSIHLATHDAITSTHSSLNGGAGEEAELFQATKAMLLVIQKEFRWVWWDAEKSDGIVGFEFVERARKESRRNIQENSGGMYM